MTIDELESASASKQPSEEDGVVVAEVVSDTLLEEDEQFIDPRIAVTVDTIFTHFFGANISKKQKKGRKGLERIIADLLEGAEDMSQDLSATLDLLEDSLFILERMISRKPDLIGTELVEHMEELADHLGQWNLGDSSRNTRP